MRRTGNGDGRGDELRPRAVLLHRCEHQRCVLVGQAVLHLGRLHTRQGVREQPCRRDHSGRLRGRHPSIENVGDPPVNVRQHRALNLGGVAVGTEPALRDLGRMQRRGTPARQAVLAPLRAACSWPASTVPRHHTAPRHHAVGSSGVREEDGAELEPEHLPGKVPSADIRVSTHGHERSAVQRQDIAEVLGSGMPPPAVAAHGIQCALTVGPRAPTFPAQ